MKLISSNSLFIGKVANYVASVDSTNVFANNLLSKSSPIDGTVIYTDHQYAGRGQIGSKWESAAGKNLIVSVILYPKFLDLSAQFKLNQVAALACYDLLGSYIMPIDKLAVKWPNDIYVGQHKIGGILIENKLRGASLASSIIGVGLNINQASFSPNLPNPTSLVLETGEEHDVYDLIGHFCECLEKRYLQLKAKQYQLLDQDYLHALYAYQEWRDYQIVKNQQIIRGKITGLSPEGKLLIQTKEQKMSFSFKEIAFLS